MKIVRFRDAAGQTHHGCRHADGGITQIAGDLFGDWSDTGKRVQDVTLLSPVMPVDILCIGLNYAQHA